MPLRVARSNVRYPFGCPQPITVKTDGPETGYRKVTGRSNRHLRMRRRCLPSKPACQSALVHRGPGGGGAACVRRQGGGGAEPGRARPARARAHGAGECGVGVEGADLLQRRCDSPGKQSERRRAVSYFRHKRVELDGAEFEISGLTSEQAEERVWR
jgi:hypothetical protein